MQDRRALTGYLQRHVDDEIDELSSALPAIALEGARGVGKTETARRRARTVHELDDPAKAAIAEADPRQLLAGRKPILVDEWQHVPPVWDAIRRAIDSNNEPNQYILTGSAGPTTPPTHSGAGRMVTVRMRPLTLSERGLAPPTVSLRNLLRGRRPELKGSTDVGLRDYVREIVASGFPGMRHLSGRPLRAQLDGYVRRVVDHGFSGPAIPRHGPLLGRLFESLATLCVRVHAQAAEATVTDGDVKNLVWLRREIGNDLLDAVVINTGPQAYRRKDGVAVVPAALLGV